MKTVVKTAKKSVKPAAKTKRAAKKPDHRELGNMICPEFASVSIGPSGVRGKNSRDMVLFTFRETHVDTPQTRASVEISYQAILNVIPSMQRTKGLKPYEIGYSVIVSRKTAANMIISEFMNWESDMGNVTVRDLFNLAARAMMAQGQLDSLAAKGDELKRQQTEFDATHPPPRPTA